MNLHIRASIMALCIALVPSVGKADPSNSEIQELRKTVELLQQLLDSQQQRIESLEKALSSPDTRASDLTSVPAPSPSIATPSGLSAFNPEIGVVADITATSSENHEDEEGNDRLSLRELELIIRHDIDPYSRFDSTITFSDFEEVAVEQAYISHWGIPGVRAQLGRMRQRIGMATSVHRDALETVDEPLVVQRYLGIEGLYRTGLELSSFAPVPWETITHELVVGTMEGGIGEDGTLFGDARRRPSFYAGLRNFWEISDSTEAELNLTWLTGSSDDNNSLDVQALGTHGRLIHRWDASIRTKLQAEGYFQNRHSTPTDLFSDSEEPQLFRSSPYGYYVLADQRISPQWSFGSRFDSVRPVYFVAGDSQEEFAYTGYITFAQSEFARWRLQYQYLDGSDHTNDNRVWLQGLFAIGAHKHSMQ